MNILKHFNFFKNKKRKITLIDENWKIVLDDIYLKHLPNNDDLIYDHINEMYYNVIKIIHPINENNICIIVNKIKQ